MDAAPSQSCDRDSAGPPACPDDATLAGLAEGSLPGAQFEAACDHAERCEACQARLARMQETVSRFSASWSGMSETALDAARGEIDSEPAVPPAPAGNPVSDETPGPALKAPCELGPYEVSELVGHGGMGEVYRARHRRLDRPVALKVIRGRRQADPAAHERFLREMAVAGQLDHPNLVRAHDAWEADGCLYLVMEWIEGNTLRQEFRPGGRRAVRDVLACMEQACAGLDHLHRLGFVHCDLKPSNLMRLADGTVKLIDIGLARPPQAAVTGGTPGYMPPEQAGGTGAVDARADIYALGRLLGYLVKRAETAPTDKSGHQCLDRLKGIAARMTEAAPEKRHQAISEVAADIRRAENGLSRPSGSRTWLLALGVLATVAAIFFSPWPANSGKDDPEPPGAEKSQVHPMRMTTIPAGEFQMGAVPGDPNALVDESPTRRVAFPRPFAMGVNEVTVAQFTEFVEATGYRTDAEINGKGGWKAGLATSFGEKSSEYFWRNPGYPLADNLPVTMVTHNDAVAFCAWLARRDGKAYRLPTEAEWEYACRAGTATIYPYAEEDRNEYSWNAYLITKNPSPRPVGSRRPNGWLLGDMMGNVREWCADWYEVKAYETPYEKAPGGPATGVHRVVRGGSFIDKDRKLRSSCRNFNPPDQVVNNHGFRVALSPPD
ncbi:MAG: hypothetical protein FJ261_11225 [Planctomycetes bacterium]|nr:hypothetical protein [Planctomycetota bacterium]